MQTLSPPANRNGLEAPAIETPDRSNGRPGIPPSALLTPQSSRGTWPWGLDTIQSSLAPYEARARKALIDAFIWCTDESHSLGRAAFASRVGVSDNTLYKLYAGKYRSPEGRLLSPPLEAIEKIETWLGLEKKRFALGETTLVETPTVREVETFCNLVRESQTIGFLQGPSHVGKTWALELGYALKYPLTYFVNVPAAGGRRGLLEATAKAMRVSCKGNLEEIKANIQRALTPDMLLIFDEVHLLAHTYSPKTFFTCMEIIRHDFRDNRKVGIVLSFTILEAVTAAKTKELQQLWRRAIHRLQLAPMPSVEDLTAILEANGLDFPDPGLELKGRYKSRSGETKEWLEKPREVLRKLAKDDGLLAITERVLYARNLARKRGRAVSWHEFIEAHLRIVKQAEERPGWV